MPAYFVFDVKEIVNDEKIEEYRAGVFATVEQYKGRYLVIGGPMEQIEGTEHPTFPVIIEFPSKEDARKWYDSPEYAPLKAMRLAGTRGNSVLIEGFAA